MAMGVLTTRWNGDVDAGEEEESCNAVVAAVWGV